MKTKTNSETKSLENLELKKLLEQRSAELAVINSVNEGLASKLDMQGIYDLVGDTIRNVFDAQVAGISIFNKTKNLEETPYLFEDGAKLNPEPRPIDAFRKLLIKNKTSIYINENADAVWKELTGEEPTVVAGTKMTKSALYVPIILNEEVEGYIDLQNVDKENAFSDSDIQLLNTLVKSMSLALENAKYINETQQRNAELAVINSVQQGLVAEMDLQGIYNLVGDKIRDLFDAQVTGIDTFDHDQGLQIFHYLFEDGNRVYPEPMALNEISKWLIVNKELLVVNTNVIEEIFKITGYTVKAVPGTQQPKSVLFVPLIIGSEVNGCVTLQNLDRENAFSNSDVRLLSTLANSMSVALENAKLFNETEQRNAELAVINSVQEGLVAEMEMQEIYNLVGDKLRDLFDAQVTGIDTFDLKNNLQIFNYLFEDGKRYNADPMPIMDISKWIIKNKKVLFINENAKAEVQKITGHVLKEVPGTKLPKSMIFVPLIIGSEVMGCVTLQNVDKEHAFSQSDVRLLSTLANSMTVALENARLFDETNRLLGETEQRNAELAVINSVQEGLVAEMDMDEIYNLVGDKLRDLFDAQVTAIDSFDHNNDLQIFNYLFEDGKRFYADSMPLNEISKWLIKHKSLIFINENADEEIFKITGEKHKEVPGTKLPKSLIFVPLIIGSEVMGCVTLQNVDKEHAFTQSDVRLLSTLANSMTVALENARLFNETNRLLKETEQRNAELGMINNVQEGLVREMEMEAIYSLVGDRICSLLNTQTLIIRTFDHEKGLEVWEYAIENGERMYSEPRPFNWANNHLIDTGEFIYIKKDYVKTAKKYGDPGVSKGLPPKSAIFVPMLVGNKVMGSVSVQNIEEEEFFSEYDLRLMSTLTNSMSVAIENARLFDETNRLLNESEQRAAELETVNNISKAIVSELDFESLIKLVGDQLRETFKADIVYLALHDRETNMLNFPYLYGEKNASRPFGDGITEKIILNKEPLLINEIMDEAYVSIDAVHKGTEVQSYLGVPIVVGSKAIGVLSVQSTAVKSRFNDYDQRLLTTIAANVGGAIQNAEAYHKLQKTFKELKSTQQQLIHSEKMASLGELTAGIAHEIQNPLNFVNNFSELNKELIEEANEELDKGDIEETKTILKDLAENSEKINHHGKRADSIVKGMLQHSRASGDHKEATDINALADEYLRLAYHGLRAKDQSFNAELVTNFDESVETVEIIPQDIGRVILNLLTNAFYVVNERKKADGKDYKPTVKISTKRKKKSIEISIEDNGKGMPDSVKDKIFQPFFTTKPTGEGTGLGLSMSYDIITKGHGGDVMVETQEGEGTTFKISIPF